MASFTRTRVMSLDVLRGAVMVIMALDHVRDFFYNPSGSAHSAALNPTDMATTFPALFFTRWITHFCAPIFLFLAGTSAFLMTQRKTKKELSAFLFKRGLWLIAMEMFVVTLVISFNPFYNVFFLQVIWAIGCSMVILSVLVYLPFRVILGIGLAIVFLHNTLNFITLPKNALVDMLYSGVFAVYQYAPQRAVIFVYAIIPWSGIMMLGYCFGKLYLPGVSATERKRKLLVMGSGLLGLFLLLRLINVYGDPQPWTSQPRGSIYSFLSFLNINKYPPSLMYFCVTIGGGMLALRLLEGMNNSFTRVMNVYGRVPFFYYVVHFFMIHTFIVILFYSRGYTNKDIVNPNAPFLFTPPGLGVSLFWVYVVWAIVVILIYPLCRWYNNYKSGHQQWWLSYV